MTTKIFTPLYMAIVGWRSGHLQEALNFTLTVLQGLNTLEKTDSYGFACGVVDFPHVAMLGGLCKFLLEIGQNTLAAQLNEKVKTICKILTPEFDFVSFDLSIFSPICLTDEKVLAFANEFTLQIPANDRVATITLLEEDSNTTETKTNNNINNNNHNNINSPMPLKDQANYVNPNLAYSNPISTYDFDAPYNNGQDYNLTNTYNLNPSPTYNPTPSPTYHSNPSPTYNNPNPTFNNPSPTPNNPSPTYNNPSPNYNKSSPSYNNQSPTFNNPSPNYNNSSPNYNNTSPNSNNTSPNHNNLSPNFDTPSPNYNSSPIYSATTYSTDGIVMDNNISITQRGSSQANKFWYQSADNAVNGFFEFSNSTNINTNNNNLINNNNEHVDTVTLIDTDIHNLNLNNEAMNSSENVDDLWALIS